MTTSSPEALAQVVSLAGARRRTATGRDGRAYALVDDARMLDLSPGSDARADALMAAADRAELEAMRARQVANRNAMYARRRPTRYAEASYETLLPHQRKGGKIERWWDSGPRALVLAGPARRGKTTAAYAIANDVQARNVWTVSWTAADLSAALKPDSGEPLTYEYATTCGLLLLDDLGRERVTDWWLEQLQRIVDARCANGRRMIVTTNHGVSVDDALDQLMQRYGTPVVERLIDDGAALYFDGPAQRRVVAEW